ncbi:hypothetical protein [uncultured Paracoccus sp.]|uniref:hypothetical protein n=1 Tax=uncultured Paracoccus sp. TaxID=189685 RepID=UPI0025EDDDC6|nr:hypothetical protein [uncultured Paracoccus sp.]
MSDGSRRVGMPPSLGEIGDEIAQSIGHPLAALLIASLPQAGSRPHRRCFYVPQRVTEAHRLVKTIGPQAAHTLCRDFGGMILQPSVRESRRYRERIVSEILRRKSAAQIAAEMGVPAVAVQAVIDQIMPAPLALAAPTP